MQLQPLALGSGATAAPQGQLAVATWNVWFDSHHRQERNRALLAELQLYRPHLLAFQEVTPPFVRALQACEWMRDNYWISAEHHSQLGVLLAGRVPVDSLSFQELPTRLGRRLLVADFPFGLRLASAHFESMGQGAEMRVRQLENAFSMLKEQRSSLLTGDFNFGDDDPESAALDPDFSDLWRHFHLEDPGYTRDTVRNPMGGKSDRRRLDRVLFRGLQPASVQLLGVKPFAEGLYPSDHFGLLGKFTL